jgi:hypothetical protein
MQIELRYDWMMFRRILKRDDLMVWTGFMLLSLGPNGCSDGS